MKKLKDYYNKRYYKTNEVVTPKKLKALELLEDTKKIGKVYNILDLGCGTGVLTQKIALKGHKVIGIDISEIAIEKLRKTGIPGKVVDVSSDGIPFSDNYFDIVFALDVFEIVRDLNFVIEEIYRILRPKGRLIFTVPYASFFLWRLKYLFGYTPNDIYPSTHCNFFSIHFVKRVFINDKWKFRKLIGEIAIPFYFWRKKNRTIRKFINKINCFCVNLIGDVEVIK